jgi:hypothetical protein
MASVALGPRLRRGGFASSAPGNRISVADQRAKLALVVEVAQEIWG